MQARYGYSFRGTRATIRRYFGRSPRLSAIAAIGIDGCLGVKVVEGSVNGPTFAQFLRDELAPLLQPYNGINDNSVVIMGKFYCVFSG